MSTSIDTVTISSIEDRRIVLANSSIARVLDVGTNWNAIRIGVRLALDDTGAGTQIRDFSRFYVGMLANPSAGVANGPMGATTSHFVGWQNTEIAWTRVAGPPVVWDCPNNQNNTAVKKVGSTSTTAALGFFGRFSASPASIRCGVLVEITKGSPNFTVQSLYFQSPALVDFSKETFIAAMQRPTMAQAEGVLDGISNNWSLPAAVNLAVNEAVDGYLNALCVTWGKTYPVMRISDIFWSKIS